jgi:hypothetical protein
VGRGGRHLRRRAKAENPADLLETATEPMHGIADREQDFWERLDAMIAA